MIKTIAIVGGGLAGAVVAQTLRSEGFDGRIVIFGDERHQPYDRPALSKAALLGSEAGPTEIFPTGWAETANIEFQTGVRVQRIDGDSGVLALDSGTSFAADRIVLATGSRARTLALPGATLAGVHSLRTWNDTIVFRDAIRPGTRLTIIGGGLIGCEIATTATKMGAHVTLLEANGVLLERVLGSEVGEFCHRELVTMGVEVHLRAQLSWIEGTTRVRAVRCADDRRIEADLVLISVGGEPAIELAVEAGLPCTSGVEVDAFGMTASPKVYAAGDVASWPLRSGGKRCLETYLNSQAQAETVARALLCKATPSLQVPKSWTEIAGHRIQVVGDIIGSGQQIVRCQADGGPAVHFRVGQDGCVEAAVAIDAPTEFAAAMRLVEGQFHPDLEKLSNPGVPLRTLLRPTK